MEKKGQRILIIDDSKIIRKLATTLLLKKGYEVLSAAHAMEGLEIIKATPPDIVLLDIMMEGMDGYQVCKTLKADEKTRDLPVILLTGKSTSADKIKGLESGAVDYITKPFNPGELLARIALQVKMKQLWDEVNEKNRILQELVNRDSLTSLYNHRYFQERLEEEFGRAVRYTTALSCVLIDIDYFKRINDTFGHQAGDAVLKSIAEKLTRSIRTIDIAARYGGEEFALILPHTPMENAVVLCERLRKNIEAEVFCFNNKNISLTISQGLAGIPDCAISSKNQLIKSADRALYTAKEKGRNRVEVFQSAFIYSIASTMRERY